MRLTAALRRLRRDERGFTMVTVMAVMVCVTLLSIAALSAAQGDLQPGAHDKSRKVAYAAAEAGVQNYLYHLSQDAEYWAKCANGAAPHAVNQAWNGTSPASDPRSWMSLPGSDARYTIELLPANGAAACDPADAGPTMIDAGSATFKIRATGEDREHGLRRSIIATFKRQSLLDFLYLTDKETRGPELYAMQVPSRITREDGNPSRDLPGWAGANCDRYWGDDPALGNRAAQLFKGDYVDSAGAAHHFTLGCLEPGFNSGENIAGPVHTNDELLIDCSPPPPTLGDSIDDAIETSSLGQTTDTGDPKGGFRMCAGAEPVVNFSTTSPPVAAGTSRPRSAPLQLPLTNTRLLDDTAPAYRFKGTTKITMNGATMRVTGTRMAAGSPALVDVDMPIPADGVVYVANDGSCEAYTPVDSAAAPQTCGNLELQGNYAANVTFTAENDLVVMDDVERTSPGSTFLLGLIATNYVRVYHPVTGCNPASPVTCNSLRGCTNAAGTPTNVAIEGAILSLTRSFIVDNWFCGAKLGTLKVYGAIAQKFRGPVYSVTPGGTEAGYDKSYEYDSRLRYRSPPHFLDPVNAQWRLQTFSEQVPAR
jgi:type II secretory pathway pseudopilin PulG